MRFAKPVKGSKILIYGAAYKRDIDDVRESPALDIMHLLRRRGAEVGYVDPHVPELRLDGETMRLSERRGVPDADCVVIVTDHSGFDYAGAPAGREADRGHPERAQGREIGQSFPPVSCKVH